MRYLIELSQTMTSLLCSYFVFSTHFACQIGSKCRKIVSIYLKHNIYVRLVIYMCKLQYILLNCNIYVHSLQNIRPSRCMGFCFILPRFNVIFDIYIAGAGAASNELTCIPRRMRAWLHQATTWRQRKKTEFSTL